MKHSVIANYRDTVLLLLVELNKALICSSCTRSGKKAGGDLFLNVKTNEDV